MADTILVVVEQREGKLNRVSWETITAGQAIAAATGWTLEAAVVGASAAAIAAEVAGKKVGKVYAVESAKLEPYTPDAFANALKQFLAAKQPKLVLMPHTYQVRDFAPKLATRFNQVLVSDVISVRWDAGTGPSSVVPANSLVGSPVFVRLLFQGKLNGDVRVSGDGPYFVSIQAGAWRADETPGRIARARSRSQVLRV